MEAYKVGIRISMPPFRLASEPEALGTRPSNRLLELDPLCARITPHVVGDGESGKDPETSQLKFAAKLHSCRIIQR